VEPDNRPGGAEQLSVFGTENCTTTGGKNKFGSLEKFCEHGGFTLAKAGFAFRRKISGMVQPARCSMTRSASSHSQPSFLASRGAMLDLPLAR
jgi:hypothetical protein